ncbi:MAG: hypothetical protein ACYDEO_12345 [Aggregatilineales bacterium]
MLKPLLKTDWRICLPFHAPLRFALCLCMIVFGGCIPTVSGVPDAPSGWLPVIAVTAASAPILRPALTVSGDSTVLAWWNTVGMGPTEGLTVVRVANRTIVQSLVLPLGHTPRALTLYPDAGGLVQALWLDSSDLPGETRLYDALIGSDLSLQRGPTLISSIDTIRYSAVTLPSHALAVTWAAHTGLAAEPLYLQTIDADGRPRAAIIISKDARHPALTIDGHGSLYIAWLEPQPDAIETVEFARYPDDFTTLTAIESNDSPIPPATPIGIVALDPGSVLDGFALDVVAGYGYIAWANTSVSGQSETNSVVYALTFPLDQPTTARQITVAGDARWPDALNSPFADNDGALPISVTLANGTPAVIWLGKGQVLRIDRFGSSSDTIEQSALTSSGDNLIAAWATLASNGAAHIYLSMWRPTP